MRSIHKIGSFVSTPRTPTTTITHTWIFCPHPAHTMKYLAPTFMNFELNTFELTNPLHFQICLALYIMKVVMANQATLNKSLLHDTLYSLLAGFGGGILVPVLLGHNDYYPFPFGNDIVVPMTIAVVLLLRLPTVLSLGKSAPAQIICSLGFELVRAKLLTTWVTRAMVVPASQFAHPVFAPILCGFFGGCGGLFMTKGIGGISTSVPWGVESALASSILFYWCKLYAKESFEILVSVDLHPQLCVAFFLVSTRLIPKLQAFMPWRIIGGALSSFHVHPAVKVKQT
jgi:hypothetical protein